MTHTPADAALWRAMLHDMPIEVIVAWLRERGYQVSTRPFFRPDRLLAPRAEDDEPLPFEVGRDE